MSVTEPKNAVERVPAELNDVCDVDAVGEKSDREIAIELPIEEGDGNGQPS